jgi:hypothetical protein
MTMRNLVVSLGLLTASALLAQGPLYDRVKVTFPYPVSVDGRVLPPGDYEIEQFEGVATGNRTLSFYGCGLKFKTSAIAVPIYDGRTPESTKLIIDRFGNDHYLNKIWIQGKDYGYEFPIPANVRMREKEKAPANVVARYTPPTPAVVAQEQATTVTEEKREQAEAAPPPPPPAPPPPMPKTAANWLNLALGGSLLAASGFALRRIRA